jgi:sugar/nucleoside kinase (ribokinase family)
MVLVSGIAVVDLIAGGLERVAAPGEVVFGSIRPSVGGHACNVSVDLVQLGFPKSAVRAVFPAGRDVFGKYLVRSLREKGVRAKAVVSGRRPTSLDLVLVARNEDRRFHADPGANLSLSPDDILPLIERHRPRIFYIGGVGILGRVDTSLARVLKKAKSTGALTFVDAVTPYQKSWTFLRRALPWTDVFHCNEDEARALAENKNAGSAMDGILALGTRTLFVTSGERGLEARLPSAAVRVPAFSVDVKDPTGAGDAFSAGLVLKIHGLLAKGRRFEDISIAEWTEALVFASAAGGVSCAGIGTTTSVRRERVERLLRDQGPGVRRGIAVTPAR